MSKPQTRGQGQEQSQPQPRTYEHPADISKYEMYEMVFDEWLSFDTIASFCESQSNNGSYVKGYAVGMGIPVAGFDTAFKEGTYLFQMCSKRQLYELYWGEGLSLTDIHKKYGTSSSTVQERYLESSIPVITDTADARCRFHDNGVPRGFGYTPPAQRSQEERGSLPDDPDGSKYLANVNHFDKDWLYQMHWGYGLSLQEIAARTDLSGSAPIHDQMRKQGIPVRDKMRHLRWEPHDGVPAMFEFSKTELQRVNSERIDDHDGTPDANTDYTLSRGETGVDWSMTTGDSDDEPKSQSQSQSESQSGRDIEAGRPYQSEQWLREQYVDKN
jgi:hypothetical protein